MVLEEGGLTQGYRKTNLRSTPCEVSMSKGILGYTLGVYGIIGFLVAFFGSRAFAVLNPSIVVVQGEVHFHHFWYGLGMVTLSGWLRSEEHTSELQSRLHLV